MSRAFSIRGYASIMRSRDVFQCWPFPTTDATADQVLSWLPPMTVPNWTADNCDHAELRSNCTASGEQENENPPPVDEEAAASRESRSSEKSSLQEEEDEAEKLEIPAVDKVVSHGDDGKRESEKSERLLSEEVVEKLENPAVVEPASHGDECERESEKLEEMVCPVCGDFKAATLTAVNVHMDGCLREDRRRRKMRMSKLKSKSKAPKKKRYIAEIFNVEDEEEKLEQEENLMEEEEEDERPEIETEMKFWPFGEDVSVTVEKFRWLSRRLEELRSNGTTGGGSQSMRSEGGKSNSASEDSSLSSPEEEEEDKLEMVCPVCRVFKAATVTAANAHIDNCLAQAMREERWQIRKKLGSNLKPKPQKKRSLTEILTVAPLIDAVSCDAPVEATVDEEKDNIERVFVKSKKNTKKNAKKKKIMVKKKSKVRKRVCVVPLLSTKSKMVKMKKPKKKKRKNKKILFAATKEDASKSKVQRSANRSTKLQGVEVDADKTVEINGIIDASFTHEKKLDLKILSEEKKEQVKSCDSVEKLQKTLSPIRGILKNHKHISGNTSSGCNVQEGTEEESHCDLQVPTSDKHVRFSGKDYTLGPKDRNSFHETASNLASDSSESSVANEHCSRSEAEAIGNSEAKRNDGNNNGINRDKGKEVCPIVESKQFCNALGQVAAQNFLQPCINQEKPKHLSEKGQSSSNVAFRDKSDRGNTTPLHCSPRSLPALQTGQVSSVNKQVPESESFISTRKLMDRMEDRTIQSATTNLNSNSNTNTRTFLGPSSSYSTPFNKGNESPEFQPHNYGDNGNNGKALGCRSSFSIFNADMTDNSYQLHGQGKGNAKENLVDQNFIGLPLNSHGELINFSSNGNSISGKLVMNQQPDTSCTLKGYFSAPMKEISHQNCQQHSSIGARNVVQKTVQDRFNPFPYYPARLGVTELHGSGRTNMFQQNSDSRSSSYFAQQVDSGLNLARSYPVDRDKTPINYMGNGMIYPKESSDPLPPSSGPSRQPTMRLMGKDVLIGGSNKEIQTFVRGSDVWTGEESRRRHYPEHSATDSSLLGRCSKQDWASGSYSHSQTPPENVLIQSDPSLQSTFLMMSSGSGFFQSNHVSQQGNPGLNKNIACSSLQWQSMSVAKPQSHISFKSQVTPLPQPDLNDWNKHHHHAASSASEFPFMRQGAEEQAKTSPFHRPSVTFATFPPWMLGSTERHPGTSASRSFPQDTRGNSFTTPSLNHSAEFRYPSNHCPPQIVAQPPYVPVTPLNKAPHSAANSGSINMSQVTDRVNLNGIMATTIDHNHHPYTNTRKRPASNFIDLTRPNKIPNIAVQGNSFGHSMVGSTGGSSSAGLQRNAGAVELGSQLNGAISSRQNQTQHLNPASPIGANSILRPSQNIDQNYTRTMNSSAIPNSATTDYDRDLELRRRLTKMHRL